MAKGFVNRLKQLYHWLICSPTQRREQRLGKAHWMYDPIMDRHYPTCSGGQWQMCGLGLTPGQIEEGLCEQHGGEQA